MAVRLNREKVERDVGYNRRYGYLSRLDEEITICAKMLKDEFVNKDILLRVRIRYVELLERRQDEYTRILDELNNKNKLRIAL